MSKSTYWRNVNYVHANTVKLFVNCFREFGVLLWLNLWVKLFEFNIGINGASVFGFLSSLPLLPPATTAVFGYYLYSVISVWNLHCIAGAGLPNHVMGEVSWDSKRRRSWASLYSVLSDWHKQKRSGYPNGQELSDTMFHIKLLESVLKRCCYKTVDPGTPAP